MRQSIKQFRTLARKNGTYEIIPVSLIRIVSDIHIGNDVPMIFALQKPTDKLLAIVHKNDDGTYNLITGWKDYIIAVRDDIKEIKAVLVNETTREEFLHNISTETIWLKLDDISISKCFSLHPPKDEKFDTYMSEITNAVYAGYLFDYLDKKPITINKHNVLIDGYTRYLALKEIKYKQKIPVIRKD